MSERAIREAAERSGLDYTVVRPGALTHEKRPKDACLVSRFACADDYGVVGFGCVWRGCFLVAARLGQTGILHLDRGGQASIHLYKSSSCGVCRLNLESARNIAHRWTHQARNRCDWKLATCRIVVRYFPPPPPRPLPKQTMSMVEKTTKFVESWLCDAHKAVALWRRSPSTPWWSMSGARVAFF